MKHMIRFDASLYPEQAVLQAAEDYQKIARIRILRREQGMECLIEKSIFDQEKTKKEFCNYVLGLSVQMSEAKDAFC